MPTTIAPKPVPKKTARKEARMTNCDHLDKIGEIAVYYGFTPAESPSVSKADLEAAKNILEGDSVDDLSESHGRLPLHAEEKIAAIRYYDERDMQSLSQPVMLYFKDPYRNSAKRSGKYQRYADLEVIGASGSVAEATLIQTARKMLAEEGYDDTVVEVNSIGDRDSATRFVRELTAYYRKHINEMSPEARQLFKADPFELLSSSAKDCAQLNAEAPKAMDFLSEPSRRHLEELLEYFESLNIPYTVNNALIPNRKYCTETIFAITDASEKSDTKEPRVLALGVRYNGLSRRLGMKRDIQGVGISLMIKGRHPELRKTLTKVKRPIASFIQLGLESKLLALDIVERLRQAKVPLHFSLAKDRLGAQVSSVERNHAPYVLVMGKKEAVERTVIVRDNDTRAQSIVPIDDIAKRMKKLEADYWKKH